MNKNKIITCIVAMSLAFTLNVQAKESHNIVYGNVSSVLITTADSNVLESTIIVVDEGILISVVMDQIRRNHWFFL